MTPLLFGLVLMLLLLATGYFNSHIRPKLNTRPPAEKILSLVEGKVEFSVHDGVDKSIQKRYDSFLDYELCDTVTGKKTWLYRDNFHGTPRVYGDLEWLNSFEKERLLSIVEGIISRRKKAYREACRIETAARHERERKAAIKVYENR